MLTYIHVSIHILTYLHEYKYTYMYSCTHIHVQLYTLRLPKARSPSRLGGLGSVVSSPSGGWGGAPETDAILNISCQNRVHFGILLVSHFKIIKSKNSI